MSNTRKELEKGEGRVARGGRDGDGGGWRPLPVAIAVAVAGPVAIALAEPQWVVIKAEQSGERGVVEIEGQWLLKINTSTRVHKLSQPPVHIVVTQRLLSPSAVSLFQQENGKEEGM